MEAEDDSILCKYRPAVSVAPGSRGIRLRLVRFRPDGGEKILDSIVTIYFVLDPNFVSASWAHVSHDKAIVPQHRDICYFKVT